MSSAQIIWYSINISKDEQEAFELSKGLSEYMMSFVNPEAVKKAKEAGEASKENSSDLDEMMKNKEDITAGFKDIGEMLGVSKKENTNNKDKLRSMSDLSGPIFDLTKDY